MKQSQEISKLATALVKAQAQMGGAHKGASNPFFKSRYADLNSVIEAVKGPLTENGLCYTQFPVSSDRAVGVCTRLIHESGEWIEEEFMFPLTKPDPQAAASLISYCRRYALQSMAGIPAVDDDAESMMVRK